LARGAGSSTEWDAGSSDDAPAAPGSRDAIAIALQTSFIIPRVIDSTNDFRSSSQSYGFCADSLSPNAYSLIVFFRVPYSFKAKYSYALLSYIGADKKRDPSCTVSTRLSRHRDTT
jgi:hypothetical protein